MSEPSLPGDELRIDFCGMELLVVDNFTFGRRAELVLDSDNRYLHGEAGRFRLRNGDWFVYNTGSKLHFNLSHESGRHVELSPSTNSRLLLGTGLIRIVAGRFTYEFDYHLESARAQTKIPSAPSDTLLYGRELTPSQLDYAVTLAEPRLLNLHRPLPTRAEIALRWGVSQNTVGRTIEGIRDRLRGEEVRNIDSQEALVDYLVTNRIVTVEHLREAHLDGPGPPRRRRDILNDPTDPNDPTDN